MLLASVGSWYSPLQEEVPTASKAGPSYYLHCGTRYDSLEELLSAREASPPPDTDEALESRILRLFSCYAEGGGAELSQSQFEGLAASLAVELSMDPRRFMNRSFSFHRFDINGDGLLDQQECLLLAECMMRHYTDEPASASQPVPGQRNSVVFDLGTRCLASHYVLEEKLGQGGQGVVHLAREIATGEARVVKTYDKSNTNAPVEEIKAEFRLLRSLDHPKIQRLYDIFEDGLNVYVVSEPYYGGHLGDLVENAYEAGVSVTSVYLAKVMFQVLRGIAYVHSRYVLHCDVKEANIMLTGDDSWHNPSAVVIDFGLAQKFASPGSSGGTPGYMPPEVWTDHLWTPKGDVFALGVVLFRLFAGGEKCFSGFGDEAVRQATLEQEPNLDVVRKGWRRCPELPELLCAMLHKDFCKRMTVREVMEHPFFQTRVTADPQDWSAEDCIPDDVIATMAALGERTKLQQAVLADIAAHLNLAGMRNLSNTFSLLDTDNDGAVSDAELREALGWYLDADAIDKVAARLVGPDGKVAFTSFMGRLLACKAADESALLWQEFERLDTDGSGFLSVGEISQLLEKPAVRAVLGSRSPESLMALLDHDSDGRVVFEEFRCALASETACS